jgi:hypothetical protein
LRVLELTEDQVSLAADELEALASLAFRLQRGFLLKQIRISEDGFQTTMRARLRRPS